VHLEVPVVGQLFYCSAQSGCSRYAIHVVFGRERICRSRFKVSLHSSAYVGGREPREGFDVQVQVQSICTHFPVVPWFWSRMSACQLIFRFHFCAHSERVAFASVFLQIFHRA